MKHGDRLKQGGFLIPKTQLKRPAPIPDLIDKKEYDIIERKHEAPLRYDAAFKEGAIRLVTQEGRPMFLSIRREGGTSAHGFEEYKEHHRSDAK